MSESEKEEKISSERISLRVCASLVLQAYDLGLDDFEENACNLLDSKCGKLAKSVLRQHEAYKVHGKKSASQHTKTQALELVADKNYGSLNYKRNRSIRFGLEYSAVVNNSAAASDEYGNNRAKSLPSKLAISAPPAQTKSAGRRLSMAVSSMLRGNPSDMPQTYDYDEVTSPRILDAPICDIRIITRGESPPEGFYRIGRTLGNKKANLNTGSGGNQFFLCIKKSKDMVGDATPITSMLVIFPDKGEFLPPGYCAVKYEKLPCNLNAGTSAERIFLCFKKEKTAGNPLTDIQIILPGNNEMAPPGFQMIDKSSTNLPANLNASTGGSRVYISYKQELRTLRCLLPIEPRIRLNSDITTSTSGDVTDMDMSTECSPSNLTRIRAPSMASSMLEDAGMMLPSSPQSEAASNILAGNRVRTTTMDSVNSSDSLTSHQGIISEHSHALIAEGIDASTLRAHEQEIDHGNSEAGTLDEDELLNIGQIAQGVPEPDSTARPEEYVAFNRARRASKILCLDDLLLDLDRDSAELGVVDCYGMSRPTPLCVTMHVILSGMYVRYAGVAHTSLQGLLLLLRETELFQTDLSRRPLPGTLTLLHVCVEAVCDRLELSLENETQPLLYFLQVVMKASKEGGHLPTCTIQRVIKSLVFLFNCQSTKVDWARTGQHMPGIGIEGGGGGGVTNDQTESLSSLFRGMPSNLTAFDVFRDLMKATLQPVELLSRGKSQNSIAQLISSLPATQDEDDGLTPALYSLEETEGDDIDSSVDTESELSNMQLIGEMVVELVDEVIDHFELVRIAEVAHKVASKPSLTVSSITFWNQINLLGKLLFRDDNLRASAMTLCCACKISWYTVRKNDNGELMLRDLGLKLIGLETLCEFLSLAGETARESKILGYFVRRLAASCIISNIPLALKDERVFQKVLSTLTLLWKRWRSHAHIEFAILVEQAIIPLMQADPKAIQPVFQMIAIQEVVTWFDQPSLLVEMFVNYDMDRSYISHWNVFSHIVRTLCGMAKSIANSSDEDEDHGEDSVNMQMGSSVTRRNVHIQALEEACRIAKTLMDAAGHAYLIVQDAELRSRSLRGGAGWVEDPTDVDVEENKTSFGEVDPLNDSGSMGSGEGQSRARGKGKRRAKSVTVRDKRAVHHQKEIYLKEGIALYHKKDRNLLKAVRYLIGKGFMQDTPQEISSFVRVYKSHFDPVAIGDFLGEGGNKSDEVEYWNQIRYRYTRAISFAEMDLEPALRMYLTKSGFRLPGEAQKVERFVDAFVKTFWQDNCGSEHCPFRHPDTAILVTYAIIMLNTDHHRANAAPEKAHRKMTKDQFISNMRGAEDGEDINKTYLENTFDNVQKNAIELAFDDNVAPRRRRNRMSVFANFGNQNLDADDEDDEDDVDGNGTPEQRRFNREVGRSLRSSEDLMRSLSHFSQHFLLTGVDLNISLDLVSFMFETVWFHFKAIPDALLKQPNQDMFVTFQALDMLCYSLTASIFLNLRVQKTQLADQLLQFQTRYCSNVSKSEDSSNDESWYAGVRDSHEGGDVMDIIATLHKLMVHLKDACQENANRELTATMARKIEKKAKVLEKNVYFVRESDCIKRSNRNGSVSNYRFFLFSDQFIYGKRQTLSSEIRVHGQLPLTTMHVSDIDSDPSQCSIYIDHPQKSFVMICDTPALKKQWLRDIHQTIANCNRRAVLRATSFTSPTKVPVKQNNNNDMDDADLEETGASSVTSTAPSTSTDTATIDVSTRSLTDQSLLQINLAGSIDATEDLENKERNLSTSGGFASSTISPTIHNAGGVSNDVEGQAAFLRSMLNSTPDRPQRLSLNKNDTQKIPTLDEDALRAFEVDTVGSNNTSPDALGLAVFRANEGFKANANEGKLPIHRTSIELEKDEDYRAL